MQLPGLVLQMVLMVMGPRSSAYGHGSQVISFLILEHIPQMLAVSDVHWWAWYLAQRLAMSLGYQPTCTRDLQQLLMRPVLVLPSAPETSTLPYSTRFSPFTPAWSILLHHHELFWPPACHAGHTYPTGLLWAQEQLTNITSKPYRQLQNQLNQLNCAQNRSLLYYQMYLLQLQSRRAILEWKKSMVGNREKTAQANVKSYSFTRECHPQVTLSRKKNRL